MSKTKGITVDKFYDFITSKISAEEALKKMLQSSLITYEKLKFDDKGKAVHPLFIASFAAMDMGWAIAIEKDEEDVRGLQMGTVEYMDKMGGK